MPSIMEKLQKLRNSGESIYAKNNTRSIVTINDDHGRLELGPSGSPDSIQSLPEGKLGLPGLQRMISKGSVEVGHFDDFKEAWRESEEATDTPAPLDDFQVTVEADKSKKDLTEKECLITGKTVFQTMEEVRSEVPPLHESVKDKASEFVVRHVEKPEGGYEVTWDRVTIG